MTQIVGPAVIIILASTIFLGYMWNHPGNTRKIAERLAKWTVRNEKGQGMIEYGLLIALISILVITLITAAGWGLNPMFARLIGIHHLHSNSPVPSLARLTCAQFHGIIPKRMTIEYRQILLQLVQAVDNRCHGGY